MMAEELEEYGLEKIQEKPRGPVYSLEGTEKEEMVSSLFDESNEYQYKYDKDSERFSVDEDAEEIIELKEKGFLDDDDAIWDFGCGVGTYLRSVQEKLEEKTGETHPLVGVDQSLRHAPRLNEWYADEMEEQPTLVEASLEELGEMPEEIVKYGSMNFTLEYTPDKQEALESVRRLLSEDGKMVFRFHHPDSVTTENINGRKKGLEENLDELERMNMEPEKQEKLKKQIGLHERVLNNMFESKDEIKDFLEENGFRVNEIREEKKIPLGGFEEKPDHFIVRAEKK